MILWVNTATLAVTFGSFVLTAVLYGRCRRPWLLWYLLYQASYAAVLFVLTFHYFGMTYLPEPGRLLTDIVGALRLAATAVVLIAYPTLVSEMVDPGTRASSRARGRASRRSILFVGLMLLIVAPNIYFVYFSAHVFAMRLINVAMNTYLLGFTVYGIAASSRGEPLKRLLRPFLWLSCGFYLYAVAAGSLLTATDRSIGYLNALSASLYCLPWIVVTTVLLFRHLSFSRPPSGLPPDFVTGHGISAREAEILALLLRGKTNREIASASFISLRTVETHLYNVFRKCGVKSRLELARKIQSYE
jgi:DNA-binding CsgD family transcriptional regulator